MSDHEEQVPELDSEAKAFLSRHQQTGEPSAEALERAKQRLTTAPSPSAKSAPVVRLAPRRRPFVPPEVMAAAAVVILLLSAQGLYLVMRTPVLETENQPNPAVPDAEVKAVTEAWRAGEYEKAARLASKDCRSAACGPLASDLAKMLGLAQRIDTLTADERDQLTTFDKKLAEGRDSAVRRKLEGPAPEPEEVRTAEQLFNEGSELKKLKHLEAAIISLEKCVRVDANYHPCYRQLGSVYAMIATRDQSAADMEKARRSYQQFLATAPDDDPFVPKVSAILDSAKGNDARPTPETKAETVVLVVGGKTTLSLGQNISRIALGDSSIADVSVAGPNAVYIEGRSEGRTTLLVWFSDNSRVSREIVVKASLDSRTEKLFVEASMATAANQWAKAFRLTQSLLKIAPNDTGGKKLEQEILMQAREFYLRGYQLRDSDPKEAIQLFKLVIATTADEDDTHRKAVSRVQELER